MPRLSGHSNARPKATAQERADLGVKVHAALQAIRVRQFSETLIYFTEAELETLFVIIERPALMP